jgi:hypothetical protein
MIPRPVLIGVAALARALGGGAASAMPLAPPSLAAKAPLTLQEKGAVVEPVHYRVRRKARVKRHHFVHPRRFHSPHFVHRPHFRSGFTFGFTFGAPFHYPRYVHPYPRVVYPHFWQPYTAYPYYGPVW